MALKATVSGTTGVSRGKAQFGPKKIVHGALAFDSSYPTNGELLLLSQVGLATIDHMDIPSHKGFTFEWDSTNKKVKVFFADYSTNVDGALIEVTNATDLSAITAAPFIAQGDE